MLAMVVNNDAGSLTPPGALRFFASMLAPTGVRAPGKAAPCSRAPSPASRLLRTSHLERR
ncbi:hypothetical protein DM828_26415 [Pseudomonas umsongensis]|nr:hypothetical protein [Pseudomonas umsongensis]